MQVLFDEKGYWTGSYCRVGKLDGGVGVESIPNEEDMIKKRCYYLDSDSEWAFDEEHYHGILSAMEENELSARKEQMIGNSKSNLSRYLSTITLESDCHGGVTRRYSITSEKQQYLATMIMTTQAARLSGIDYQPSWNATGEECTYDWTLEELQQLAFEMEAVVRPLISKQQALEVQINQAESLEELQAIDISFGGEV